MVWNRSRSGLMELKVAEIKSASPVETGTVMMTRIKVFFNACKKYGSWST